MSRPDRPNRSARSPARAWDADVAARQRLAGERGTIHKEAATRVALVYPSPYRAAMSSLGYQQIYRLLNAVPGLAADRAMQPDDVAAARAAGAPLLTLETRRPVGDYPLLAFSVAYELELAGLIDCLDLAGIPPLARDRDDRHPLVIAGGPLTFSNPVPLAPFCDVIVVGEADRLAAELVATAEECGWRRAALVAALRGRDGYYLPDVHGATPPPVAKADDALLPARSVILTPDAELADMFLVEPARGCSRGCTYCVMRRSTNGGMRIVEPADVLATIPGDARRVGLVGAAVTDHPRIREIVRGVVDGGREVGISSLRADKLDDELVGLLARGGYRTLTVAGDGASERMRRVIERSTKERHLLESARLAAVHQLRTVKIYMMVGVPGETDDDVDELVRFTGELLAVHPRIAYGVAPFVAKRHTPLDGSPFAGIAVVEARLARLRQGLARYRGKAELRPTSARWAWVEYMLAQGDERAGLALLDAHRAGGSFAAYKAAFEARGAVPTGPRARVPSSAEVIALRRRDREAESAS
ncbi:MAG TPA: radical SAM protein [Kofleriaceae bacterium]|nr:radical SAM protein [Kofleriaceae bacterium]